MLMIAHVKYNDLRGTVAADVNDFIHNNLQLYLQEKFHYDADRYTCVGCRLWINDANRVSVHFVCADNQNHTYVQMETEDFWSLERVFRLFKRTEIVLLNEQVEDIATPPNEPIVLTMK